MPSFEGDALFVKELFGFIVSMITIIGVPKAFYDAGTRWSTRLLSNLAMDEDEMGYFTAYRRCWLWVFALFYIPTVDVPRVPSPGTLIRAGDDGVWTSAMILDGRVNTDRAKDPVVSWVMIYEAWFREYAWALDQYEIDHDNTGDWDMAHRWRSVIEGESMERYREEAAFEVWKLKHRVCSSAWDRRTRSRWVEPFSGLRKWFIYKITYRVDTFLHWFVRTLHAIFYTYESLRGHIIRLSHQLNTVDVELDFIPRVDRHLLYYPWRIYAKESSPATGPRSVFKRVATVHQCESGNPPTARRSKDIRPILVSCVRPLEHLYSVSTADVGHRAQSRRKLKGDEKGQRLRIFNQVPAIKISEEDLGAWCMVLGVETKGEPDLFLPHGRGALGHLLSSHRDNGMNIVRLGYHEKMDLADDRPAGSGYSTLFAKHLACGCIPFGFSTTEQGIPMVHTIPITPKVDRLIREGNCLSDANSPSRKDIWAFESIRFLRAMPKNGDAMNFYCEPYTGLANGHQNGIGGQESMQVSHYTFSGEVTAGQSLVVIENVGLTEDTPQSVEKISMGGIYPIDNRTKVPYCCREWSRAVAGIAFGGLVPFTTRGLANLVGFSVGVAGKLEGKDMEALRSLTKLVVEEFSAQTCGAGDNGVLLFGKRIIQDIQHTLDGMSVDYDSEASGTHNLPRDLTRKFGWLATLLEALVAMVKEKERPSSPDLVFGGAFKRGQWKREEVFEACATQIQKTYVATVNANTSEEGPLRPGIADLLKEPIEELKAKKCEISAENCGTVARCILMAWVRMVKIVDWKNRDDEESLNDREEWDLREACNLLTLEELPDIALWE